MQATRHATEPLCAYRNIISYAPLFNIDKNRTAGEAILGWVHKGEGGKPGNAEDRNSILGSTQLYHGGSLQVPEFKVDDFIVENNKAAIIAGSKYGILAMCPC